MITRMSRRLIGFALWPPSRAIAAVLAWSHRQTVAMWARSLAAELQRKPFDPKRLVALVKVLWKASTDPRLRGGGIRALSVDTDVLSDNGQSYRSSVVKATLLDVPGVVSVDIGDGIEPVEQAAAHDPAAADLSTLVEPV